MLASKPYDPSDPELSNLRDICAMDFLPAFNTVYNDRSKSVCINYLFYERLFCFTLFIF